MKTLIISFSSIAVRLLYGLLKYPYQTVQQITAHQPFSPLLLTPLAVFVVLKIIWYFIVWVIFGPLSGFLVSLLANWLIFFCFYWQILLLYLAFRFWDHKRISTDN